MPVPATRRAERGTELRRCSHSPPACRPVDGALWSGVADAAARAAALVFLSVVFPEAAPAAVRAMALVGSSAAVARAALAAARGNPEAPARSRRPGLQLPAELGAAARGTRSRQAPRQTAVQGRKSSAPEAAPVLSSEAGSGGVHVLPNTQSRCLLGTSPSPSCGGRKLALQLQTTVSYRFTRTRTRTDRQTVRGKAASGHTMRALPRRAAAASQPDRQTDGRTHFSCGR
jgi:hypothetical protein